MYISDFFYIWKSNRMALFCNLFIERPSYVGLYALSQKVDHQLMVIILSNLTDFQS